jgi:hypothetical protein
MARMWEYRDDHEPEESREKARERHAQAMAEMKERRKREKHEKYLAEAKANANAREKVVALRKVEPMEQNTMSNTTPQFITVEQYNAMIEKFKRFVAHVNRNFNELAQQVEQLKETVNALKPGKQTKKFQGRSVELEAEIEELTAGSTPEIDTSNTTDVAGKVAAAMAKGNAQ